jgi:hypothetical protein
MVSSHMKCSLFESTRILAPCGPIIPRSKYVVLSTYDESTGKCIASVRFNRNGDTYTEKELLDMNFYPDNS